MRPALFLDRDGVVNVDHGYVHRPEDFEFIPGIFDLVRCANRLDFAVIIVTNQSGIGRGYYSDDQFTKLSAWMCENFNGMGARIDAVYHCPDAPRSDESANTRAADSWRKPNPGMILRAAEDHKLDLPRSAMLGDKDSDVSAGAAAGLGLIMRLVAPSERERTGRAECTVVTSIPDAKDALASWAAGLISE